MPHGPEQRRGQELPAAALAVEVNVDEIVGVKLDFNPGPAVRNNPVRIQDGAVGMGALLKANTRGAVQLTHNDAFGAIDNEAARAGHQGNLTHEDILFTDFLSVLQTKSDIKRGRVCRAFTKAFHLRHLCGLDFVFHEIKRTLAIMTLNGKNLFEHRLESDRFAFHRIQIRLEKLHEGFALDLNEVWRCDHLFNGSVIRSLSHAAPYRGKLETPAKNVKMPCRQANRSPPSHFGRW